MCEHYIGKIFILITGYLLAACSATQSSPGVPVQTSLPVVTLLPQSVTPYLLPSAMSSQSPRLSPTVRLPAKPTILPIPDPYDAYTIEYLAGRSYGGGTLQVEKVLEVNNYFTRTLFSYPSDNLRIYGFINSPLMVSASQPVIIVLHGYVELAAYDTIDYTTPYADALARAGFLVLHPNLRGYPPSDSGDNFLRVGMAIDVLNLAALVREQAGKPGPLEYADPQRIGIWGHSMGGGIGIRVITISPDIRAVLLYASASSDDRQNYELIYGTLKDSTPGIDQLSLLEEAFLRISPVYYLDRIQAAVSIHHGKLDKDIPLAWSLDLCRRLQALGKLVECFTYEDQAHTFDGDGYELLMQRTIDFFNRTLR